jgi:hypothetical protein
MVAAGERGLRKILVVDIVDGYVHPIPPSTCLHIHIMRVLMDGWMDVFQVT